MLETQEPPMPPVAGAAPSPIHWYAAGEQQMVGAALAWWDAVGRASQVWSAPANAWLSGLDCWQAMWLPRVEEAQGRSWYRHPGPHRPGLESAALGFAMMAPASMFFGGHRLDPTSQLAVMAAMPPFVREWYAAWIEGASRAMLPAPMAAAVDAMRHPQSHIPFVSYRSDGGHAVAQIGYTTARTFAAWLPLTACAGSVGWA